MITRQERRKARKGNMRGDIDRPRLVVFRSLKHLYAQIIDDSTSHTLVSYSSLCKEFKDQFTNTNLKSLELFSNELLRRMSDKNIKTIIFDKNGFRYSGVIERLASLLRKGGIVF